MRWRGRCVNEQMIVVCGADRRTVRHNEFPFHGVRLFPYSPHSRTKTQPVNLLSSRAGKRPSKRTEREREGAELSRCADGLSPLSPKSSKEVDGGEKGGEKKAGSRPASSGSRKSSPKAKAKS